MPNIDLSILNQRQTPAFYADTLANRPAAGFVGRIFVSTDTYAFYRDNGTSWDLIGGPGTGTITGSGSSGSLALWNGTNTITYDVNITWNGTDNSISADKFIVNSGTSSQFLKGDGSLDSSAYVTTNIYNGNGTLSGERTISLNGNNLIFDGGASIARVRMDADTNVARIFSFATNNLPRWAFRIDGTESGSDAGSDFAIRRYNDAGTFVDAPLTVTRSTGQSTFAKKVVIENNAGDQQLQIVSTSAPSLRLDNLQTGATKRAGLGISTATNNFIQGSVDRDFCIFNGSTAAASPILFGIYDAGAVNVQEAARISPARNFLIGTTTDAGQKLQVSGTTFLSGNTTIRSASTNQLTLDGGTTVQSRIVIARGSDDNAQGMTIGYSNITSYRTSTPLASPQTDFSLNQQGSNGTRTVFYMSSDGNIGINTVSPTSLLTVQGRGVSPLVMSLNSANPNCDIFLQSSVSTNAVRLRNGTDDFSVFTNGVQRTTVSSSGNLLIGTTTDAGQKLQVNGSAIASSFASTTGTISVPSVTPTTFFTASSRGLYIAHIYLAGNQTQTWDASIIFNFNATNILIANQINGTNVSISVSGANINVTQIGGSTFTFNFEVIRIA